MTPLCVPLPLDLPNLGLMGILKTLLGRGGGQVGTPRPHPEVHVLPTQTSPLLPIDTLHRAPDHHPESLEQRGAPHLPHSRCDCSPCLLTNDPRTRFLKSRRYVSSPTNNLACPVVCIDTMMIVFFEPPFVVNPPTLLNSCYPFLPELVPSFFCIIISFRTLPPFL